MGSSSPPWLSWFWRFRCRASCFCRHARCTSLSLFKPPAYLLAMRSAISWICGKVSSLPVFGDGTQAPISLPWSPLAKLGRLVSQATTPFQGSRADGLTLVFRGAKRKGIGADLSRA